MNAMLAVLLSWKAAIVYAFLASALWATDKAELEVHLDGMRGIRDIQYLAVLESGRGERDR